MSKQSCRNWIIFLTTWLPVGIGDIFASAWLCCTVLLFQILFTVLRSQLLTRGRIDCSQQHILSMGDTAMLLLAGLSIPCRTLCIKTWM